MSLPHWSQASLFASLKEPQRQRLERMVVTRRLDPEQVLFHEGDPCAGFAVVTQGAIQLTRMSDVPGAHPTLAVILPVASFAEAAMFGDEAYPVTATAIKPSTVHLFPKRDFLAALQEEPALAQAIIHAQAVWLRTLTQKIQQLTTADSTERLVAWLDRSLPSQGSFRLPLTKKALAAQLGMTPETLSRSLRALQDRGALQVTGSELSRGPRPLKAP